MEKIFSADDLEKTKKLGVKSVLDLALIIPSKFDDRRLSKEIENGSNIVIDATITDIVRTPKTLKITFFAHNLDMVIEGVIFNPKRYMLAQFIRDTRGFYSGKAQLNLGKYSIMQPVKLTAVGDIVALYKTALRADVMRRLVSKYITIDNLIADNLPPKIAQKLYEIHFPPIIKPLDEESFDALKFGELFSYMRRLQLKRRYFKSDYIARGDIASWSKQLPFTLTDDQKKVIDEISSDLKSGIAARRIIVGDVGSGKTMVILASVLLIMPNRSILMAPTTILASQLYEEAQKFLPHLKITLVTNATKKEPLESYDFIIGTHALLYRELPESGLIMIDEQHRFGTAQRNLLAKIVDNSSNAHFLQFSATPIPRTQAMIDSAHIDVSLITQTPFTKKISTKIISKSDFKPLIEHIKSEIAKNHQILIIYPLVQQSEMIDYQSLEEARGYWEKNFSGVYLTHGKDKEKEGVLIEFRESGNILLATTVVEVGISLPRLSTIVIVGAERLGLSTLHQLRGRVSRTGLDGYCYLYSNKTQKNERLESFAKTTSGFDIAALDLKFRSSGDLLDGDVQSGKSFRFVDLSSDEEIATRVNNHIKELANHQQI